MYNLERKFDKVFLSLFFVILFLPMLYISNAKKSEIENRTLAQKPSLFIDGDINDKYGVQFNEYFNDRFFCRNLMVSLYNILTMSVNSNIENNFAMIGKNGFMYTKKYNSIDMYKNNNLFTNEELQKIGNNISVFVNDAKKAGVKTVYFLLSNDKESMYAEYYPDHIKKVGNTSRLEQLLDYMYTNYPDIKLYNFKDEFEKIKKEEIVFCKTGTHMNNIGSYYEYYFLMDKIKSDYPRLNLLTLDNFNIKLDYKCDEDILKTLLTSSYQTKLYSRENLKNKQLSLKKSNAKISKNVNADKIQHNYKIFENNENKDKPNLLILGDSFVGYYVRYLAESFHRVQHIYNGLSVGSFMYTDDEVADIRKNIPDIIVVESAERGLQNFLTLKFPTKR